MKVVDARGILPYEPRFDAGTFAGKTSTTAHWPGIEIDPSMDDAAALELVERLAQGHIDRDWSAVFGHQGGAGLMYHEVLAPSGTIFITRDPDAIAWHAEAAVMKMPGNPNTTSHALLVLYGSHLTPAQRRSLAEILPARPRPAFGNSEWMSTACPGPELLALIQQFRATGQVALAQEEEMTPAQEAKLDRALALLEAREDLVWAARAQRGYDVETGVPFDAARPPQDSRVAAFPGQPPAPGAVYAGASADLSVVIWDYPDGTRHFRKDGDDIAVLA